MSIQQLLRKWLYTLGRRMMKYRIVRFVAHYWSHIILGLLIVGYIGYFSFFTIMRYRTLYAHYFDLGIMQQTVYNTFMAIKTGDYSRFLEMTNPQGYTQVKRMSVHNDILLAFLAPFYFLYSGPETLLVIQSVVLGLGALIVYALGLHIFGKDNRARLIALFFAFAYLMYPPLQRANQFDFHAVVLATTFLLAMFYFFIKRKYLWSFLLLALSLLSKEQVGLTTAFFGFFVIIQSFFVPQADKKRTIIFGVLVSAISIAWFLVSMKYIIPHFRNSLHFALSYYGDFGDSTQGVFLGLVEKPQAVLSHVFRFDTLQYLFTMLGPFGLVSLLSPFHLAIAAPEFAINILSNDGNMRNIYYQYSAVITPFVVISALYGFSHFLHLSKKINRFSWFFISLYTVCVFYFSLTISPLPYSATKEVHPFLWPIQERISAFVWQKKLDNDDIKIMASGHIAPVFASHRYVYNFSDHYDLADYIVLSVDEIYNSYGSDRTKAVYNQLVSDARFSLIYKNGTFEVFKKL